MIFLPLLSELRALVASGTLLVGLKGLQAPKKAILDGCSTVDSMLDYDGIGWYSMILHGTRWYFAIE